MADKLGVLNALSGFTEGLTKGLLMRQEMEEQKAFRMKQLEQQAKRDQLSVDRFEQSKLEFEEQMAFQKEKEANRRREKKAALALERQKLQKEQLEDAQKEIEASLKSNTTQYAALSKTATQLEKIKSEKEDELRGNPMLSQKDREGLEAEVKYYNTKLNNLEQRLQDNKKYNEVLQTKLLQVDPAFKAKTAQDQAYAEAGVAIEKIFRADSLRQVRSLADEFKNTPAAQIPEARSAVLKAVEDYAANNMEATNERRRRTADAEAIDAKYQQTLEEEAMQAGVDLGYLDDLFGHIGKGLSEKQTGLRSGLNKGDTLGEVLKEAKGELTDPEGKSSAYDEARSKMRKKLSDRKK